MTTTTHVPPPSVLSASVPPPVKIQEYEPAGVGRRWVAVFVDSAVSYIIQLPFTLLIGLVFGLRNTVVLDAKQAGSVGAQLVGWVVSLTVMFCYYGWFNANKGATPGKMLMKLRLVRNDDGTRLGWGRSFGREICKAFLMLPGVFFVIFRQDKRALHDLICDTKVLRLKD